MGESFWLIRSVISILTQCPQCGKRYKENNIINLYVPEIAVPNNDLETVSYALLFVGGICHHLVMLIWFVQQVLLLREKNESLEKQVRSLFFVQSSFLLEFDISILSHSNYHKLHILLPKLIRSLCFHTASKVTWRDKRA